LRVAFPLMVVCLVDVVVEKEVSKLVSLLCNEVGALSHV
jgi:hypothetical protein